MITDRLGSVRWREGAGAIGYYPYGQVRTGSANVQNGYGTYFRDGSGNLDYADRRYYGSTHARFLTPDPYQGSAGPSEPGSWNRFAYVMADPVNSVDPSGLCASGAEYPIAYCSTFDLAWLGLMTERRILEMEANPQDQWDIAWRQLRESSLLHQANTLAALQRLDEG